MLSSPGQNSPDGTEPSPRLPGGGKVEVHIPVLSDLIGGGLSGGLSMGVKLEPIEAKSDKRE
jgi:hypothetical protein